MGRGAVDGNPRGSASGAGGASRARFDDGRWHYQHGPIDLIIDCDGDHAACESAIEMSWERFQGVLGELVPLLPMLRSPLGIGNGDPDKVEPDKVEPGKRDPAVTIATATYSIAARMIDACRPYAERHGLFITPMAAVAGSVADEIVSVFRQPGIDRAYVNNGGDIALHLAAGTRYDVGVVTDLAHAAIDGRFSLDSHAQIRGIATSGWRGRSFSLGIADSVTVLASTAAAADAAATMIANHVDVSSAAVARRPANELKDDTDLGDRLVTVAVGALSSQEIEQALARGEHFALGLRQQGLIAAVAIALAGQTRVVRSR